MDEEIRKMIETYQCPGCVCGSDTSCFEAADSSREAQCVKHVAGTMIMPHVGRIFLGMPIGFCRLGPWDELTITIWEKYEYCFPYDMFNIPVWKYLDEHGNTLVRGIRPRINVPFLHIFKGNQMDRIDCMPITAKEIEGMD